LSRRVLIDECLPVQLHRWLVGHEARSTAFMGWKGLRNGELVAEATSRFEVILTADARIVSTAKLRRSGLSLLVVPSNRRSEVERLVPAILDALTRIAPGEVVRVPLTTGRG
jgi:predicted nuclease of predicted toxin-antitoxin system